MALIFWMAFSLMGMCTLSVTDDEEIIDDINVETAKVNNEEAAEEAAENASMPPNIAKQLTDMGIVYPAPQVSDKSWGTDENSWRISEPEGEDHEDPKDMMEVINTAPCFGVVAPPRHEILEAFQQTGSVDAKAMAGRSGASFMVSNDKRYLAKKIVKLELKYAHKLHNALCRMNPQADAEKKLIVPIYYLFQRCNVKDWDDDYQLNSFFHNLNDDQAKGLWRQCEAWMVSPMLSTEIADENKESITQVSYDIKGDHYVPLGLDLLKAQDEQFREDVPGGFSICEQVIKDLKVGLRGAARLLRQLEIYDYSLLIKVSKLPENGICEGSHDSFTAVADAYSPHLDGELMADPKRQKCLALGIIDYLGHTFTGLTRWLGIVEGDVYGDEFLRDMIGASEQFDKLRNREGPPKVPYFQSRQCT